MTLTLELPPEKEAELKAQAEAEGLTLEAFAERELRRLLGVERPSNEQPIWEAIVDNMRDVPASEFEKAPADGAAQVDHYLYGHPKR